MLSGILAADLPRGEGQDGSVGYIEHLHSVGQVPGEFGLDEKGVHAIVVEAGMDGGDFVIVDDADQRMKDRRMHEGRVDIGIGQLQDVLHSWVISA